MAPKKISDQPLRTCLGCRQKLPKDRLLRLAAVRDSSGALTAAADISQTLPGRGGWVCRDNPGCWARAAKPACLARAFRVTSGSIRPAAGQFPSFSIKEQVS
ncbi:MAG: YlxR family protein [Deltaproteobacteria bacterium]|nr:YlxR family protein [Deltaproteobacteria bacterium]